MSIKAIVRLLKETGRDTCCICYEMLEESNLYVIECSHCVCMECLRKIKECPMCRIPIKKTLETKPKYPCIVKGCKNERFIGTYCDDCRYNRKNFSYKHDSNREKYHQWIQVCKKKFTPYSHFLETYERSQKPTE